MYCYVEFYSDLKRSISQLLSSVEGCYVECVSPRAVWHLILHKINPGQDSYFRCMINRQIMWRLILGRLTSDVGKEVPIHFHIHHQILCLPTPSDHRRTNL